MTDKNQKTMLIVGTMILATAGTGLTLFNNLDFESKQTLIRSLPMAFALAAAFTAAEFAFAWLHKSFESASKRWRKVACIVFMILVAASMTLAFLQELSLVHQKQKGDLTTKYTSKLFEQAKDGRTQRMLARTNKIEIQMPDIWPFGLCYFLAAVGYIVASACYEKKRRRYGAGNIINQPSVRQAVESRVGFMAGNVSAYRDNKENGVQYRVDGRYKGFISDRELNNENS